MRAVIQRAASAEITIDHKETRRIGEGLVVFLGVLKGDTSAHAEFMAEKISELRIFSDEDDKMNLSLKDNSGDILVVSNFTLGADCKKGRRPSFDLSAPPSEANELYECFVQALRKHIKGSIATGEFGAHMDVCVNNNGPVTIIIDTDKIARFSKDKENKS